MSLRYVRGRDGKVRREFLIPPKFALWMLPVYIVMLYTQKIIHEKRTLKHFRKNYIVRMKTINFYGLEMRIVYIEPKPKKTKKTTEDIQILTLDTEQEKESGQE